MNSENKESALDELRDHSNDENYSQLNFTEPTLKDFRIDDVLEAKPQPKKRVPFGKRSQRKASELSIKEEVAPEAFTEPQVEVPADQEPIVIIDDPVVDQPAVIDDVAPAVYELKVDSVPKEEEEEEVEIPDEIDQDDPEIFYEKKKFLTSQYEDAQDYLEEQSQNGYHFIGRKGKRFFFKEGKPKHYYYNYCYFEYDPEALEWRQWEQQGWKLITQSVGRSKHDAGWYVFRNERSAENGDYKKEIDNDNEKYRLFRKLSNSYRSTIFLFFVIMAICAVTGFLQYKFNGFLITLISCVVIFVISLFFFITYFKYLMSSSSVKRKLKTKIRLKEKDEFIRSQNVPDYSENEDQLDTDWKTLDEADQKAKEKKKRK